MLYAHWQWRFFFFFGKNTKCNLHSNGNSRGLRTLFDSVLYHKEFSLTSRAVRSRWIFVFKSLLVKQKDLTSVSCGWSAVCLFAPAESRELLLSPCDLLSNKTQSISFANCYVCNSLLRICHIRYVWGDGRWIGSSNNLERCWTQAQIQL